MSASVCVLLLAANSYCSGTGTSIFPILKINPSTYSSGMGEINGVVSSQVIADNPAVLPFIMETRFDVQHILYLSDINYSMLTFVKPIGEEKAFGISAGYVGAANLPKTVYDSSNINSYIQTGDFSFSDTLFNLCYGQKFGDSLSLGLGLKGVKETIDINDTYGAMASVSCRYVFENNMDVNAGFINIGPQVKGFDLPNGGYLSLGKDVTRDFYLAGEVIGYSDQITELHSGLEYHLSDALAIRVGYKYPFKDQGLGDFPDVNITGGLGLKLKSFSFDYAWIPYGDLGMTHRISIGSRIGKRKVKKEVFKPVYNLVKQKMQSGVTKINIAVIDFEAKRVPSLTAAAVSNLLRKNLINSNNYNVFDNQNAEAILGAHNIEYNSCQNIGCAVKAGKLLNVKQVIIGSLSRISNVCYIAVNLIDVESGNILDSEVQEVENLNNLEIECEKLTNKILRSR